MMLMDQVKKAQEQLSENATVEEVMERFEALQNELNERFEAAQHELNERFEEATSRFANANEWVAENVTSRIATLPGAERLPQPADVVSSYFDTIERITASNREIATRLVSPWMIGADGTKVKATAEAAAATKPTARKSAAKKATARKATARKGTAKKATARKATARKSTATKATAGTSAASTSTEA